jgi:GNAT superfamily N-acetyltransferase
MRITEVNGETHRDDIERLHCELFVGGKASVPSLVRGYWWLAYDAGRPVAFGGLVHSQYYQKSGYLIRSGVSWGNQGQGLQKRLIRARLNKARRLGWQWVMTDTSTRNPASANSLISCGFKMFVPWKKWNGRDSVYWQRRL